MNFPTQQKRTKTQKRKKLGEKCDIFPDFFFLLFRARENRGNGSVAALDPQSGHASNSSGGGGDLTRVYRKWEGVDPHTLNLLHRRKWKKEKREKKREFLSEFPACVCCHVGGGKKKALVVARVPFW